MSRKPCFVFNCKSSYNKENESLAFFHPPKLCLNSWQEIIKKPGLTCQSRICSIHFEENDILKGREIQGVFYSYPKWKLKSGARPSKLLGNDVSVLERPAAKKYVHSDRFKSPYRNITAKSKAANPKLQLDNQSFLSNNNTNVLIPSHAKKSTSNSIAIHQLDAEKGKVNDMEAAEPVALPCVTTEDMFQEPTTETLLHIPPISCQECKETVVCEEADLPDDFTAKQYTAFRNRGGLIFVTIPVFQSIREVEKIISSQFEDDGHYLVRDSYEICMSKIKVLNLCPFFCDTHRADSYPYLIMEFVQVRYHFESKRFQERNLAEVDSNVRQNFKMAKLA
ncbi:uncharacterized protein LOC124207423 [Daphnia pulex]|uniref:uncharacterized protein LOC124207423 n=1 Tax=Daphnia pulex TaxID=6669 RepID=UPI001EE0A89E|nr:uncharacterized protein LOC124207423 [Daphnia pulex]XP_046460832.1 uncharacterized protein LOC124207423 [Daphnia pulex]XP_046460833.1 uncharacterized protein LOC124207423 [Daphnia pulex]